MSDHDGLGVIESILTVEPTDDVGADTADRFRFQAALAAERVIAMVIDQRIAAVICEWHEDYVVQFANGPSEIVSVKHHDSDQNHWTVKQLCAAGGLKHLYERFKLLDESVTCRLQTNETLRAGSGEGGGLRDACKSQIPEDIARWAKVLAGEFGEDDVTSVARFLGGLVIDDGRPDRTHIESVHLQELLPSLASHLGLGPGESSRVYRAVVDEVAAASAGEGRHLVLETLVDPSTMTVESERARVLANKTIDRDRAKRAIRVARALPDVLLDAPVEPSGTRTRLVKKLEAGGCGGTTISAARRLRANWERHKSAWSSELPGSDRVLEHLRTHVVRLASVAEVRTRNADDFYADAMYTELEQLLRDSDLHRQGHGPLTIELLLGLAFERTEECEIFWSEVFDPDVVP